MCSTPDAGVDKHFAVGEDHLLAEGCRHLGSGPKADIMCCTPKLAGGYCDDKKPLPDAIDPEDEKAVKKFKPPEVKEKDFKPPSASGSSASSSSSSGSGSATAPASSLPDPTECALLSDK
jgi:hypothetical protein